MRPQRHPEKRSIDLTRPFASLTERGKARRLRRLALDALAAYPFDVLRLRFMMDHLNAIFQVDTTEGKRYVLRVSAPTWRTDDDLRAEICWLQALAQEPDIGAPVLVANRAGELITIAAAAGVPEPRRCVVMSWIPGKNLEYELTEQRLQQLGQLSARLHAQAAGWQPPAEFKPATMNAYNARGEPDLLFAPESDELFSVESRPVFLEVRRRVEAAFADLYADSAGLRPIHNDLHQENVKIWRGKLRPLDFEDTILGYPVQDIAMTFSDLLYYCNLDNDGYERLREAFIRGYRDAAEWPETNPNQSNLFMAGRLLWRANWVVRFQHEYAHGFLDRMTPSLQRFLDNGRLLL